MGLALDSGSPLPVCSFHLLILGGNCFWVVMVVGRTISLTQELGAKNNLGSEMLRSVGLVLLGFSLHVTCSPLCLALL